MNEDDILLAIHELSGPILDGVFLFSHQLGTGAFCSGLVMLAVSYALLHKRYEEAALWIALGVSTWVLQEGIKVAVGRPRPALWDGPVHLTSYAFPSGHALAAATFYPLIARAASLRWPHLRPVALAIAVAMAAYIGLGRLYLGVHWPSDVLAGWTIGALQTCVAITYLERRRARALGPR